MGGVLLNCDELKVRRLFHAVISSTTFSYISSGFMKQLNDYYFEFHIKN